MFISLCIIFVTFPLVCFSLFKFKKLLIEMFFLLKKSYGSIYSRFGYMVTTLQFSLIVFYTLILFIFNGFCFVVSWDKDLVIHLK